jgi:hypothetical protein
MSYDFCMSRAGGGKGFDYQADVFAGAAKSMLTASLLHWFDDIDDTLIAISLETDGPGDDLKKRIRRTTPTETCGPTQPRGPKLRADRSTR